MYASCVIFTTASPCDLLCVSPYDFFKEDVVLNSWPCDYNCARRDLPFFAPDYTILHAVVAYWSLT